MSLAEVPLTEYSSVVNWLTAGTVATCQARPFQCSMSWLRRPVPPPLCDPTAHALVGDAAYTSRRMPNPEVGPGVMVQATCAGVAAASTATVGTIATAGTIAPHSNATYLRCLICLMTCGSPCHVSGTGRATAASCTAPPDRGLASIVTSGPGQVLNAFCRAAPAIHRALPLSGG